MLNQLNEDLKLLSYSQACSATTFLRKTPKPVLATLHMVTTYNQGVLLLDTIDWERTINLL